MDSYKTILVEKNGGITTIKFNRPEKKNAMSPTLHREMAHILTELQFDPEIQVLILTGVGDSFCAGQDLKEYFYELKDKPREAELTVKLAAEWRGRMIPKLPVPVIASVNGWCFGGAFGIVANCDLAIAAEEAKFALSEINFGTFPAGIVPRAILDTLSWRNVMYYSLTGETFDGKRAAEIGLVNYGVPRDKLESETLKLANKLLEKNRIGLKQTKEALRVIRRMPNEDDALSYAMAKSNETSYLQKGEWVEKGIGQFMKGEYRPGLGSYKKE